MSFLVDAIGGFIGATAQKNQAQKSISDYQNAVDWSKQSNQDARTAELAAFQPTYNVGVNSLNSASNMLQPGYNFQTSDPSYQWRLNQGLDAVQGSAAANGLLHSGGTLKALTNYGQGAASQEFQNQFNRFNTLAGYAPEAARGIATANQAYANNMQNAYFAGANGMAQGRQNFGQAAAAQVGAIGNALTGSSPGGTSMANAAASFFGF